jgi:hypothetical protein
MVGDASVRCGAGGAHTGKMKKIFGGGIEDEES